MKDCTCSVPLVRYCAGWVCVRCHPERLAPCPVCKQRVTTTDHRHTVAEVFAS